MITHCLHRGYTNLSTLTGFCRNICVINFACIRLSKNITITMIVQGGSNMTGTDVARFTHKSVPVIFEPPCINTSLSFVSKCMNSSREICKITALPCWKYRQPTCRMSLQLRVTSLDGIPVVNSCLGRPKRMPS